MCKLFPDILSGPGCEWRERRADVLVSLSEWLPLQLMCLVDELEDIRDVLPKRLNLVHVGQLIRKGISK